MRKIYESLNERLHIVAKDMDKKCADRTVMFALLSSYDYQFREAVGEIEKLWKLVVKKRTGTFGAGARKCLKHTEEQDSPH